MRLLPESLDLAIKPTHYRLKEVTISYNPLKYKIIIAIGFLSGETFNEIGILESVNLSFASIELALTQAANAGKLDGGKSKETRLQEILDTQAIVDTFTYACIEDLHTLGIIELPRYYTY